MITNRKLMVGALLFGSALCPVQVMAQTANASTPTPPTGSDQQAQIDALQAQVQALQTQLEQIKAAIPKATPSWKGAPELADKDSGFSFKPKGFVQFDAGYVGFPDGRELNGTVGGLNYNNLGFNTRARRLVFGAEGSLPGGFKYKAEFNFAQGNVDYEDILLSYDFKDSPLTVTVGNFYPYSSLETVTSSRLGSMLERASFTDAFNYNRRLGVGLSLADKKADRYTLAAGIFSQPINDGSFNRTGWEVGARGTFTPKIADGFLHLGASAHYRKNNRDSQGAQYRSRPLTQVTDQRFVDTGTIASDGDVAAGVELGGVFKSLHFAAEGQKLWVRGYKPTDVLTEPNDAIAGTRYSGDPSFAGGYAEVGFYLTGESRGYKGGKWDRTKVLKPFDKGGWGAVQLNGRIDYLDLKDGVGGNLVAGSYPSGSSSTFINGGKQIGYQVSLIWNPMDYVRFMAQYGRVHVTGGPRAATVDADSSASIGQRSFNVDTAAVRAQLEF
nr:porin [uncultured Sphingomonas sp.]